MTKTRSPAVDALEELLQILKQKTFTTVGEDGLPTEQPVLTDDEVEQVMSKT